MYNIYLDEYQIYGNITTFNWAENKKAGYSYL